ncbi:hypothetical protein GCM10009738_28060 [Kitasatospora viridis]
MTSATRRVLPWDTDVHTMTAFMIALLTAHWAPRLSRTSSGQGTRGGCDISAVSNSRPPCGAGAARASGREGARRVAVLAAASGEGEQAVARDGGVRAQG